MTKTADQIYDEWLVLKVRSGDMEAVSALVKRWQPAALSYAQIVTREKELAAEAVQESWISGIRAIRKLRDPARFRPWFYKIIHNQCINGLRTHQKHLKVNAAQILEVDLMQASDNMDSLEHQELVNLVLSQMPENQRVILTLFYLSELEVDEIAELLKLPSGTVKSRLHTARGAFRRLSESSESPTYPREAFSPGVQYDE